jgi:hypothetical protein
LVLMQVRAADALAAQLWALELNPAAASHVLVHGATTAGMVTAFHRASDGLLGTFVCMLL